MCVLEAMKTEHVLRAPRAGVVARVAASAGEMVGEGVELVGFEADEASVDASAAPAEADAKSATV